MGLGDLLGGIFGGKNKFQATLPPVLGAPRQPGEDPQQYANRLYGNYASKDRALDKGIAQAGTMGVPQDVLDFSQANQTAGQQNALNQILGQRMNQNIDYGTGQNISQQQALIDQVLAQGRGEGPNPALQQLRMTTDQNIQQAAAMNAANRGINPALAARSAAMGGAALNQQAGGQAALQAAQQQLSAQQLGGGLLGQQIGQLTQQAGLNAQNQAGYGQLLGSLLGQQRGMDITQAGQQGQAGLNLMTQRTNAEAMRRQAQDNYRNLIANIYGNANAVNAGVAAQNANTASQYGMAGMAGLSSALTGGLFNKGGEVPNPFQNHVAKKMFSGGVTPESMNFFNRQLENAMGATTRAGGNLSASVSGLGGKLGSKLKEAFENPVDFSAPSVAKGIQSDLLPQARGPFSLTSSDLLPVAASPFTLGAPVLSEGGKVLGRAEEEGDSEENDTVPALLSPGEVVIPRSAMESKEDAHAFLEKILTKNEGPNYRSIKHAQESYHNMAHGGQMKSCPYCMADGGKVKPIKGEKPWYENIFGPSADKKEIMASREIWGKPVKRGK